MRNPNYTYADTMKPTLDDEGHRKNPFIKYKQRERPYVKGMGSMGVEAFFPEPFLAIPSLP